MTTTHQPQEILLKVMCSERLPSEAGYYKTNIGEIYYSQKYVSFLNEFGSKLNPTHWYEPATRVVLTVEEWEEINKKLFMYDNGLGDHDMINDNKPTDI